MKKSKEQQREVTFERLDVVLFRGSEHVVLKKGKIGDTPDHPDGEYYSNEQTYFIASVTFQSEDDAIGYWIPSRLLTETGEVHRFASEQVVTEPSVSDRVMEFLKGGNKPIGEIAQAVGKPSAAIFSTLSSLKKKGMVERLDDNTWVSLVTFSAGFH